MKRCVLAVLVLAVAACAAPPDTNLVIVTIDTLRPDHLSAYGYGRETSPRIAALAAEGARFDLAYAPMSATHPSHTTLFTGEYPITHGVVKNGMRLPEERETLAEILAARGYRTAGFVSSFVLDARFGLAQGFETWGDDFSGERPSFVVSRWEGHEVTTTFDRRADETTRHAVHWLESLESGGAPFFLFVHYFDPHAPYAPPAAAGLRFDAGGAERETVQRNLYDAEIAYVDGQLGTLLDAIERLNLRDETLLVLTSDHGEGLWEHGAKMHGVQIYEEQIRIPLVMRWPGRIPSGRRVGAPVGLIDVMPTVLDLLGIAPDGHAFAGTSLAPTVLGGADPPQRAVHAHREPYVPGIVDGVRVAGEQFSVREGPWKYIEGPVQGNRELFHLGRDPGERENLYYDEPAVAQRLRERLASWRERYAGERLPTGFADEDREALEALGYVE